MPLLDNGKRTRSRKLITGWPIDGLTRPLRTRPGWLFYSALGRWHDHLRGRLTLPCEVTGKEDFRWEEPYVFGLLSRTDYDALRKARPSFKDVFILESIAASAGYEWALSADDLGALVRRKDDGLTFVLGLSELSPIEEDGPNARLLEDYSYWFANCR